MTSSEIHTEYTQYWNEPETSGVCNYLLGICELVPFVVYKETAVNMLKILGTAT